ncbi:MAG: hypothetical protein DI589_13745 [Shinella sp.]|nr:MAG: hypothetical protein DI589_13745 [Shinella sp.]
MTISQAEFDAAYDPLRDASALLGCLKALTYSMYEGGPSEGLSDRKMLRDLAISTTVVYDMIEKGLNALSYLEPSYSNDGGEA